jgi:hypothetical protein
MNQKWFQYGDWKSITCVNCTDIIEDMTWSDHQPRICPSCNIECIYYDMGNRRMVQIVPEFAPETFQAFLNWTRKELDEIEVVELFCAFEALGSSRNHNPKPE